MKTTTQKLKLTLQEYEDLLFGAYARWCENVTINDREFQKALANYAINKWYLTEYAKCEAEFLQLTNRYEECDTIIAEDFKRCYAECTYRLFNIRPMALLKEIKKSPTTSTIINGIKIHTLAFNQN